MASQNLYLAFRPRPIAWLIFFVSCVFMHASIACPGSPRNGCFISLITTNPPTAVTATSAGVSMTSPNFDIIGNSCTGCHGTRTWQIYLKYGTAAPPSTATSSVANGTTASATIPLTCGTSYVVRAHVDLLTHNGTSSNKFYDGNTQNFSSLSCAPPEPTNLSASDGVFEGKVQVTWNASGGATSYQVFRSSTNSPGSAVQLLPTINTLQFNDTTATGGTTFFYFVKACNAGGCSTLLDSDSGFSLTPLPLAPTGVVASDGGIAGRVRITWNATNGATGGYQVYRDTINNSLAPTLLTQTKIQALQFDDTTAAIGTTYFYYLKACRLVGGGCSTAYSTPNAGFVTNDQDGDSTVDSADPDDDNDGMPDTFETKYRFDPFNPADALLDADGDGISNLNEFTGGTNPRDVRTAPWTLFLFR